MGIFHYFFWKTYPRHFISLPAQKLLYLLHFSNFLHTCANVCIFYIAYNYIVLFQKTEHGRRGSPRRYSCHAAPPIFSLIYIIGNPTLSLVCGKLKMVSRPGQGYSSIKEIFFLFSGKINKNKNKTKYSEQNWKQLPRSLI